jgi:hypothetical protein
MFGQKRSQLFEAAEAERRYNPDLISESPIATLVRALVDDAGNVVLRASDFELVGDLYLLKGSKLPTQHLLLEGTGGGNFEHDAGGGNLDFAWNPSGDHFDNSDTTISDANILRLLNNHPDEQGDGGASLGLSARRVDVLGWGDVSLDMVINAQELNWLCGLIVTGSLVINGITTPVLTLPVTEVYVSNSGTPILTISGISRTLNLPNLVRIGSVGVSNTFVVTINDPELTALNLNGSLAVYTDAALVIVCPLLTTCTTLTQNVVLFHDGANLNVSGCRFITTAINELIASTMASCVTVGDVTYGTLNCGGTCQPPEGQGLVDAKTLHDDYGITVTYSTPKNATVSGAGTAGVNGVYTFTGIHDGKPFYNKAGTNPVVQAISWDSGDHFWHIWDSVGDPPYISSSAVMSPWDATGWFTDTGVAPIPTVTRAA